MCKLKVQWCPECHAQVDIDPRTGMPFWDDCGECGALLPHARPTEPHEIGWMIVTLCLLGIIAILLVCHK
jgi:hypothetical protein